MDDPNESGALRGLSVLDLSTGPAAAYCTKWFADFGAEVVLIEDPDRPSEVRRHAPHPGDSPAPERGALHTYLHAGKRSAAVSMRTDSGRELVRRLTAKADLLIEDSPPGTMHDLGLGYETLGSDNPGLVYVSVTPFGHTGPYRDHPATDLTLAAWSGTLSVRRTSGRHPIDMGGRQGGYIGGRVAFIAAMGAVLHRNRTSIGQHVDVALLEAIAGNDMAAPTTFSYNGIKLPPAADATERGRGGQGNYPCRDGQVSVIPGIGGMKKLAVLLGDPALADHELFRDHALRARRADEFDRTFLLPYLEQHTRAEIVEAAQKLGMPFSYVLEPDELIDEPQLTVRGFFVRHTGDDGRTVVMPGSPVHMSKTNPRCAGPVPHPGASTRDVLREWLALGEVEVDELVRAADSHHG